MIWRDIRNVCIETTRFHTPCPLAAKAPTFISQVHVYTAFYDPKRSFEETRQGLFPIYTRGNFLPRAIFGRFIALCAYIRCLWIALCIAFDSTVRGRDYDVVIVDQVRSARFL